MPEAPSHYLCNNPNGKVDDDVVITKNNNNKALEYIEDVTSNADEIQTRVLAEILSSSAHAEYLQRHGLDGRTERESFKKIMPVVTYEDLKPDIDRIANGDTSPILCSKPISEFLTRSVLLLCLNLIHILNFFHSSSLSFIVLLTIELSHSTYTW